MVGVRRSHGAHFGRRATVARHTLWQVCDGRTMVFRIKKHAKTGSKESKIRQRTVKNEGKKHKNRQRRGKNKAKNC